ncbi:MAG: hypothetical protein LAO21_04735 [Acidobacteriia bacterium]|nr:hypothetical protein [Terriglobia bacterium]
MLIQTNDVPAGVSKPCGDLGRVRSNRLNDLTSAGDDSVEAVKALDLRPDDLPFSRRLAERPTSKASGSDGDVT